MQFDQYTLFFILAILAAGLSAYLAGIVIRMRPSPGRVPFSLMMATIAIWNASIAIGMFAETEQSALLWVSIRMIAIVLTPPGWFIFAAAHIGRDRLISRNAILLILIIPTVTLIAFLTNNAHGLFYTLLDFTRSGPFLIDTTWEFGAFFYIHLVYSFALILAGDLLLLQEAIRLADRYKRQAITLIAATLIPLGATLVEVFRPFPGLKVNIDPFALTLTGLILGWGIFYNQLFDLSPIARDILIDNMIDGMIVVNQNNTIVDLNPSAERIFAISESVIGTDLDDLFYQIELEPLQPNDLEERHHIKLDTRDGIHRFYDIQTSTIKRNQALRGTIITIRDITSQKRIEDQLQYLAITDSLTGLANHRHFYELLNNELERSKRSFIPFSVIMFDIDHFKQVNDTHGHLIGDQVLREISIVCQTGLRQYDIVCRYGGEELSIILPGSDLRSAAATAERLREIIGSNTFQIADNEFNLTISLGVSSYDPYNPVSARELVSQADSSLYISKENGRNQVTIYQPDRAG